VFFSLAPAASLNVEFVCEKTANSERLIERCRHQLSQEAHL
jgi:hypothetical protein